MPAYSPRVNGNLTNATTFGQCCHFVPPQATTIQVVNLTTAGNNGSTFTLAAPTEIDAIGIYLYGRTSNVPNAILTARLINNATGNEVWGCSGSLALESIPIRSSANGYGWAIIRFTPVVVPAGTYYVNFTLPVATAQLSALFNNSIGGNPIVHFVRTTIQVAPGGNDQIIVAGEYDSDPLPNQAILGQDDFNRTLVGTSSGDTTWKTLVAANVTGGVADNPTWVPTTLAGVVSAPIVRDAVTAGTLWQDLAKTIPANADGHLVRVFGDSWFPAIEFTTPSDATRPTLKTDGTNWWLEGDGTKYFTGPALVPATGYAGAMISAAFRPAVVGQWRGVIADRVVGSSANSISLALYTRGDGNNFVGTQLGSDAGNIPIAAGSDYVGSLLTPVSATRTTRLGGVHSRAGNGSSTLTTTAGVESRLMTGRVVGTEDWNGRFYGAIFHAGIPTGNNIANIERYLGLTHGTTTDPNWSINGNVIRSPRGGVDPNFLIYDVDVGVDYVVQADVRVDAWGADGGARAGISARHVTTTTSSGIGLVFRGDTPNTVYFIRHGLAWDSNFSFNWSTGVWYTFKLLVRGGLVHGKVWPTASPEPPGWRLFNNIGASSPTGRPALVGQTILSGMSNTQVSYDNFVVRSIPPLPTNAITPRTLTIDTTPSSPVTFQYMAVSYEGTARHDITKSTLLRFATNGGNISGTLYPLAITGGGRFEMGSTANPVPSNFTATLECVGHSTTDIGVMVWESGVFLVCGTDNRTRRTILTGNTTAGSNALTHQSVSNWQIGDIIAVSTTSRTNFPGNGTNQNEIRTISTPGTTNTVVSSPFTHAHDGGVTPPGSGFTFGGMVINLTRNCAIQGTSTTSTIAIFYNTGATLDVRFCQHRFFGSATTSKRGYEIAGNTIGSFLVRDSSFYDMAATNVAARCFNHQPGTGYVSVINNVGYGTGGGNGWVNSTVPAQNDVIVTGNTFINYSAAFLFGDLNLICDDNWSGGCTAAFETSAFVPTRSFREFDDNYGFIGETFFTPFFPGSYYINRARTWRFRDSIYRTSLDLSSSYLNSLGNPFTEWEDLISSGCGTSGTSVAATLQSRRTDTMVIRNSKIYAEASNPVPRLFNFNNTGSGNFEVYNSILGATSWAPTSLILGSRSHIRALFDNCAIVTSGTLIEDQSSLIPAPGTGIGFTNYNQVAGDNRTLKSTGNITTDAAIFRTSAPSMRMTPASATFKLTSEGILSGFLVPCAAGSFKTINVYIRKSALADGAAYNGNQPRLIMRPNSAGGGASSPQVLATMTGTTTGAWQLLTGVTPSAAINTTFEFYIDCDGTAGWINVDDISVT